MDLANFSRDRIRGILANYQSKEGDERAGRLQELESRWNSLFGEIVSEINAYSMSSSDIDGFVGDLHSEISSTVGEIPSPEESAGIVIGDMTSAISKIRHSSKQSDTVQALLDWLAAHCDKVAFVAAGEDLSWETVWTSKGFGEAEQAISVEAGALPSDAGPEPLQYFIADQFDQGPISFDLFQTLNLNDRPWLGFAAAHPDFSSQQLENEFAILTACAELQLENLILREGMNIPVAGMPIAIEEPEPELETELETETETEPEAQAVDAERIDIVEEIEDIDEAEESVPFADEAPEIEAEEAVVALEAEDAAEAVDVAEAEEQFVEEELAEEESAAEDLAEVAEETAALAEEELISEVEMGPEEAVVDAAEEALDEAESETAEGLEAAAALIGGDAEEVSMPVIEGFEEPIGEAAEKEATEVAVEAFTAHSDEELDIPDAFGEAAETPLAVSEIEDEDDIEDEGEIETGPIETPSESHSIEFDTADIGPAVTSPSESELSVAAVVDDDEGQSLIEVAEVATDTEDVVSIPEEAKEDLSQTAEIGLPKDSEDEDFDIYKEVTEEEAKEADAGSEEAKSEGSMPSIEFLSQDEDIESQIGLELEMEETPSEGNVPDVLLDPEITDEIQRAPDETSDVGEVTPPPIQFDSQVDIEPAPESDVDADERVETDFFATHQVEPIDEADAQSIDADDEERPSGVFDFDSSAVNQSAAGDMTRDFFEGGAEEDELELEVEATLEEEQPAQHATQTAEFETGDLPEVGTASAPSLGEIDPADGLAEGEVQRHEDAIRFARLLVKEIKLYNEDAVVEGRESGNLYEKLYNDIERSRQVYYERYPDIDESTDYFERLLVDILAEGDKSKMGERPQ